MFIGDLDKLFCDLSVQVFCPLFFYWVIYPFLKKLILEVLFVFWIQMVTFYLPIIYLSIYLSMIYHLSSINFILSLYMISCFTLLTVSSVKEKFLIFTGSNFSFSFFSSQRVCSLESFFWMTHNSSFTPHSTWHLFSLMHP